MKIYKIKNNQYGFGAIGIIILVVIVFAVGFVAIRVFQPKTSIIINDAQGPFSTYDIDSSTGNFSIDFYDSGELVESGSNKQVVVTGDDNRKIGVWVKEIDQTASCGNEAEFSYSSKYELINACNRSDGLIYASTIKKDSKYYFVSITAQKSVPRSDASKIFSSLVLK